MPLQNVQQVVQRWGVSCELATRLAQMERVFQNDTGHLLEVFSGFRTCEDQERLRREGRPAAPCDRSTHTTCPATGADVRPQGVFPSDQVKQQFGAAATLAGLRWGGGSPTDDRGIPTDWNHVDLGPRPQEAS